MKPFVRNLFLLVALVLGPALGRPDAVEAPKPRLVVLLVVDQLRGDYLRDYAKLFTAGFKRLTQEGAWFVNAAYPYLNTVTCPGHSTIGTGALPYRHGMVMNGWLDRATGRLPYCTADPAAADISYSGLTAGQGESAHQLLAPTLAEQVHEQGGRSVSLSLKPRGAIPLAGRKADAVVWFDARGGWSTSTAYTDKPVPFLQAFFEANTLAADYGKTWTRALPLEAYRYTDDAPGEGTESGWTRTFPHPLGTEGGKPDATFFARWQRSPFADEYLARMAIAAVDALQLGRRDVPDFLGISFSALDVVGHTFGPRSHEVQDTLIRLDHTIACLLDHLDRTVGTGNYVVGLSADHGVADIPEQVKRGGRQPNAIALKQLRASFEKLLGPGAHVLAVNYTDIYLSAAANARLAGDPALLRAAVRAMRELPAVDRVFRRDELSAERARRSRDPALRAAALGYHPERSGDFVVVPKKDWLLSSSVTTHGTHYPHDARVPVILFGAPFKAAKLRTPATPADLAPTLAFAAGVRIAPTDGRVLQEAVQ